MKCAEDQELLQALCMKCRTAESIRAEFGLTEQELVAFGKQHAQEILQRLAHNDWWWRYDEQQRLESEDWHDGG